MRKIGVLITDKDNDAINALFACEMDNDSHWVEEHNEYINVNIQDISLEIQQENNNIKYVYKIRHTEKYFIELINLETFEIISEKILLKDLVTKLLEENTVDIICNTKIKKQIILNTFDNTITITEFSLLKYRNTGNIIEIKF